MYTTGLIKEHQVQQFNMANYPFPMYSADLEKEKGYSNALVEFKNDIQKATGLIISISEHNGYPSAYFKNMVDWLSRLERKFLMDKKILLLATSPGKRGGMGALEVVKLMLPRFGAEIVTTFSLPSFLENFDMDDGIKDKALATKHLQALNTFLDTL